MRPGSRLKDSMTGSSKRKRPLGMLLLLALGMAVLGGLLLNKLRERRLFGLLLQDRDQQLLALQLLLQKEQDHSKEIKRKLEDMKAKAFTLRTQKMELTNKLTETQVTTAYHVRIQKEMEAALQEKQNQINALMEKEAQTIKENLRVATLTGLLKEKEAEIEEMKHQQINSPKHNDENTSRSDTSNDNVTEAEKHEDENTSRGNTLNGNITEADKHEDENTSKGDTSNENSTEAEKHEDENTSRSNTSNDSVTEAEKHEDESTSRSDTSNDNATEAEKHEDKNTSRGDILNDNVAEADKHDGGATTQNESVEQLSNSGEGIDAPKEGKVGDANGITGKEQQNKPREGQWVKFNTNADDVGVNDEGNSNTDQNAENTGKEQLEKIKDIEGGEQTREASEISQGGIDSEAKGGQVVKLREGNAREKNRSRVHEDTDLESQEKFPDGNEQQAASMEPKLAVESNDPKMKHRRRRRNKTKGRKQRMPTTRGDEQDRHNDGNLGDSEKNEGRKDESSDDKQGSALNNNLPQLPESSETIERQAEAGQKDDKNASEVGRNDGKSAMTSNSGYGEDGSKSLENAAISESDGSNHKAGGSIIEAKKESIDSNNQHLQKSQNSDGTENSQKYGDGPNEIAKTGEQTELASADGLSDTHDSSRVTEDSMASGNTDNATVDLRKVSNDIEHDDSVKDVIHNESNQEQEDLQKQNNNDTTKF